MRITSYEDMKRIFNSASRARKVKGTRVLTNYIRMMENEDKSYSLGSIRTSSGVDIFDPQLTVTPDNILRARNVKPDYRLIAPFGLHVGRKKTVKRRGEPFLDVWAKGGAVHFWQSEPFEYDLTNRKSLNEDVTELKWDRVKHREFNTWMRELKSQFYVRAKLGILLTPESAPHFFKADMPKGWYRYHYWGRKKLADPMKVFEAIKFDDAVQLQPFTALMSGHVNNAATIADAFPYEQQTAEIDRIFAANKKLLQEQFGARQYE